jgi:hypothetical protein
MIKNLQKIGGIAELSHTAYPNSQADTFGAY